MFFNDKIKGAFIIVMGIGCPGNIVGDGIPFFCFIKNFFFGNIYEFSFLINEVFDQPGAGNSVNLWPFAGYPFYNEIVCCNVCIPLPLE